MRPPSRYFCKRPHPYWVPHREVDNRIGLHRSRQKDSVPAVFSIQIVLPYAELTHCPDNRIKPLKTGSDPSSNDYLVTTFSEFRLLYPFEISFRITKCGYFRTKINYLKADWIGSRSIRVLDERKPQIGGIIKLVSDNGLPWKVLSLEQSWSREKETVPPATCAYRDKIK